MNASLWMELSLLASVSRIRAKQECCPIRTYVRILNMVNLNRDRRQKRYNSAEADLVFRELSERGGRGSYSNDTNTSTSEWTFR